MHDATSCMDLGLANQSIKDSALIKRLSAEQEPCVLVAWDNKMHRQHGQALRHFDFTLAVIDREADRGGLNDEEYYRDVIHRHAHRMATQAQGAIWMYNRVRRRRLPLG
ncbi:MAG: hypothetical protein M3131_01595 [Actinomycetota bacterium]|nr:hypothetical protein [Actinomycetota bacterium]